MNNPNTAQQRPPGPESIEYVVKRLLIETLEGTPGRLQADNAIDADTDLVDAGIDSLDLVEFHLRVESAFGFKIPEDDRSTLRSIQAAASYVRGRGAVGGL